jgi:D-sedoheptulose 7-phosphate isomerase
MALNQKEYTGSYLTQLQDLIAVIPQGQVAEIAAAIRDAQENHKHVFVFGNGGSAATASHMACDFGKNTRKPDHPRLRISSLNDSIPTLMAYANDEGYENVFAEPLLSDGDEGDLVIAISGSGNSPNVIKGLETARSLKMKTIGLTGFKGGKMKDLTDICLIVPSNNMEMIEDIHMIVNHLLTGLLRGGFYGC